MKDEFDPELAVILDEVDWPERKEVREPLDGYEVADDLHDPAALQDAHLARTVADRALRNQYCWTAALGWLHFAGGRWVAATEVSVLEQVRRAVISQYAEEASDGAKVERLHALTTMQSTHRLKALVTLARGILEVDSDVFDQHPDLLNVGNGVLDLRTGRLMPHDPGLYLTRITTVDYVPNATSSDWDEALAAVPRDVEAWLQIRFGQAATGHMTPDDMMPVLQGGGSNGKTTVTGAIMSALGDHAVSVPERVLLANPGDHPTELMTLRGARLALIEETPQGGQLSTKRLKDTLGTPTMTARQVRRDNVTWKASHSMFLTSNYVPLVTETDHGTWRRLALVKFPYTYTAVASTGPGEGARPASPGLRERLRDDPQRREAVLAWVVAGARLWYLAGKQIPKPPASVIEDTSAWRAGVDELMRYIRDRIIFVQDGHIVSTDLYEDFNQWRREKRLGEWRDQMLSDRFAKHDLVVAHGVAKDRLVSGRPGLSRPRHASKPLPDRYMAWVGVAFAATDEAGAT